MEPAALVFLSPLAGLSLRQALDHLVRMHAERKQWFGTFFLRNRAELELLRRVITQKPCASSLNKLMLACSKGADVYSMVWTIRSVRPDLQLNLHRHSAGHSGFCCKGSLFTFQP